MLGDDDDDIRSPSGPASQASTSLCLGDMDTTARKQLRAAVWTCTSMWEGRRGGEG